MEQDRHSQMHHITMATSPLLALPSEIRQCILAYLLDHPECDGQPPRSLTDSPPRVLDTAILRTCRQLYAESAPLLYSGTVHLEVSRTSGPFRLVARDDSYSLCVVYRCRQFRLEALPAAIRERTSKVAVRICAHRSDKFYRVDHIQEQVRRVAGLLKRQPNWRHVVSVSAHTFVGTPLCDAEDRWPPELQPLLPLSYVRGRESVGCCYGVEPDFAAALVEAVTSAAGHPQLLVDLDEMFDAFAALVRSTLPPPLQPGRRRTETDFLLVRGAQEGQRLLTQLHDRCGPARDQGDVARFLSERTTLVRKLRDEVLDRQRTFSLPITLLDPGAVLRELDAILVDC